MQPRIMFVGVDAHIDPPRRTSVFTIRRGKFAIAHGRTEASAPTGRFAISPNIVQFYDCVLPGRCGHRPLRTLLRGRRECAQICLCIPHGRGKPLPYVTTKRGNSSERTTSDPFRRFAPPPLGHQGEALERAYKKAAATRLPLYFTASGSWFYGRRRAGWRTFCCWSRT